MKTSKKLAILVFSIMLFGVMLFGNELSVKAITGENWFWPVSGYTNISSGYGYRTHPISGEWKLHAGIDIWAPIGTPVRASQSGYLVVKADSPADRGKWSVIDHQNGWYSDYQHLNAHAGTSRWVNQGDVIGYVGKTGAVTAEHLHFEIRGGGLNQAGNYDSLTPYNTNKDSVYYVYGLDKDRVASPWISMAKNVFGVGENVKFNFGATRATGYVLGIDRNGTRIATPDTAGATSYSRFFTEPGNYTVYVTAYNGHSGLDSKTLSFRVVGKPENPWIKINKTSVKVGESVTFDVGATGATGYLMGINRDGVRISTPDLAGKTTYTTSFQQTGNYTAYVTCYNGHSGIDSKAISFEVYQDAPLKSFELSHKSLTLEVSKTVTISVKNITPANTNSNKTPSWTSSNTGVATVTKDGTVKAIKAGNATITCQIAGVKKSLVVTVKKAAATTVKVPNKAKITNTSANSLKITWEKVADVSGYELYYATSKNGRYTKIASGTKLSHVHKKLKNNKTYYYKVRSYKTSKGKNVYSAYSSIANKKVVLGKPSAKVRDTGKSSISLTWKKVSGAQKYEIYRATSKNGEYKKIATTKSTNYKNTKLSKNKPYYYKIRAVQKISNKTYRSPYSSIIPARTLK